MYKSINLYKKYKREEFNYISLFLQIADFLIYKRNNSHFEILVLATTSPSMASIGGNKAIVYTCEISNNFCTRAICVIDLLRPFRMLYHGMSKPLNILGIPSLSKQLHQMEIQV